VPAIRLSASRLASLELCSFKFYCNEVLKLPEAPNAKTVTGSCLHSILEALIKPKHRKHYELIKAAQSIHASPAISRLVRWWKVKHSIPEDIIADVNPMTLLVINDTDFFCEGAEELYPPEHEFLFETKTAPLKGFIDKLARYKDYMKIIDYKSKGKRFTDDELRNNYQASVYQLYVWKKFKLKSIVEFVMARHAPTKRTPDKHLQIVPAKSEAQLRGFEIYLESVGERFQSFGLEDAYSDFAAHDPKRKSFCQYVCQFKNAFDYIAVLKKTDKGNELVKTYSMDAKIELAEGEFSEIRHFNGCPAFNF
jgi:hypothetical protein